MKTCEITQRNLEAYQDAILEVLADEKNHLRLQRLTVEAARDAGIVAFTDDLLDLPPHEVLARFQTTITHLRAAQEGPDLGE